MAVAPPNNVINEVIKAFGLDPDRVFSFRLDINVGEVVTIQAGMLVSPEHMKELGAKIPTLLKRYELTEVNGDMRKPHMKVSGERINGELVNVDVRKKDSPSPDGLAEGSRIDNDSEKTIYKD